MRTHPTNLRGELDDATVAYVLDMGRPFEDLRHVAAQLAGVLFLIAAGSKRATLQHTVLELAGASFERAMEGIKSVAVPARAAHHHSHLREAARLLGATLASCNRNGMLAADMDLIFSSLSEAWDQLSAAAAALPGFEIVAFGQACCAEHVRLARLN